MSRSLIEDQELAYLAGFFDADGCVGVYGHGKAEQVRLAVVGVHRDSIDRYQRAFGGNIFLQRRTGAHRGLWQWYVSGRVALETLEKLLPFLNVKAPQAREALRLSPRPLGHRLTDAERSLRTEVARRVKELKAEIA